MAISRKPFQGVFNIIKFNWHFYLLSFALIVLMLFASFLIPVFYPYVITASVIIALLSIISLLVSFYVYDVSSLYQLKWFNKFNEGKPVTILNINAGFDETSELLQVKFKKAALVIFDFYDVEKHTEISIKRARKAYPPHPYSITVNTNNLPLENNSIDFAIAILSAHEIRDERERITFFEGLNRIIKPEGYIFITEHLRDLSNLLAYNIGFLHFHSRATWIRTFTKAGLKIVEEEKTTPFITTFILQRHDHTH